MRKTILLFMMMLWWGLPTQAYGRQVVPILVYHSIDEFKGHGSKELYVTPENFEKQMQFLKKNGFTLLTFERWKDISKVKKPIFITLDDGYKNNQNAFVVFQKLKDDQFQPVATMFVISNFIGQPNRLTNEDLKKMSDSGFFSIQSHTATHPDLTKIQNADYELNTSKIKIENITGKAVIALSYPFGNFNKQVVNETKKYYLFGLTTTPGPYVERGVADDLFVLPRTYVKYSTTMEDFARIVRGGK
ncbi:polysaccharide deacetylase family protein [Neobacillus sp. D3-1R]|uniref:polysaccharide deacetylase family protein n=1 Tax=Neobacillus sp. D3-1R TaxID=3445778 RepID=UPI003FA05AB3